MYVYMHIVGGHAKVRRAPRRRTDRSRSSEYSILYVLYYTIYTILANTLIYYNILYYAML